MRAKKVLLVFLALLCLLPTVTVALFAQQPDSPAIKRASTAKQTGAALDPYSPLEVQRHCRELLKPIEGLKHIRNTFERRARADKIWDSFFEAKSDAELIAAETEFRDCLVEPPSVALRRDALQAYLALRDAQNVRLSLSSAEASGELDQEKAEELALVNELKIKQSKLSDAQASFAEAANFAVTLYKQRQEYKEAYEGEVRAYDRLSDLTDQVLALAKQAVYRSSGPSWEALVNPPKPQIIRIETPAVPRSLYCSSSTMPPAAPGLETWTWTNCHW